MEPVSLVVSHNDISLDITSLDVHFLITTNVPSPVVLASDVVQLIYGPLSLDDLSRSD
jgi:hypothetical protein